MIHELRSLQRENEDWGGGGHWRANGDGLGPGYAALPELWRIYARERRVPKSSVSAGGSH
jgi:hypothetical protein